MSAYDFSVSVQGSPAYPVSPVADLDSLPLPDHYPEPYCDSYLDCSPSSPCTGDAAPQQYSNHVVQPRLETGDAARCSDYSSSSLRQALPAKVDAAARQSRAACSAESQEAKEGVRRITDKYAAPGTLVRTSSASSPGFFSSSAAAADMPAHAAARQPAAAASMNSLHSSVESGNGGRLRVGTGSVSAFSDASSDLSDASPIPPWTSNISTTSGSTSGGLEAAGLTHGVGGGSSSRLLSVGGVSLATLGDGVTEQDVQQVEMFYRSHKSEVTVCRSLANLYFGSGVRQAAEAGSGGGGPASGSDLWEFVSTGIPLLLLDSGQHVRERKLSVVLAEKGTGFVLWKDVITHLTHYSCPHGNFHTLRVSSDNNKLAGLSFDDAKAAGDFAATIRHLTSDPDDDLLMLSKKGKKKKRQETKRGKYKPPKKTDISQPCCFQHVTKLERPQLLGGELLPPPPNGFPPAPNGSLSSLSDSFQDKVTLDLPRARSQSSELSEASSATSDH